MDELDPDNDELSAEETEAIAGGGEGEGIALMGDGIVLLTPPS